MKVDFTSGRTAGAILRLAVQVYRRHALAFVSIAALQLPLRLVPRNYPATILISVASGAAQLILGGALIALVYFAVCDRALGIRDALQISRARLGALVTTTLLIVPLTIASLIAFPYFLVRWSFAFTPIMLDNKRNWAALDSSSQLVRGNWRHVIATTVLGSAPGLLVSALSLDLTAASINAPTHRALTALAFTILMPFQVAVHTILYLDLEVRHGRDIGAPVLDGGVA